jgi:hypothetical protein
MCFDLFPLLLLIGLYSLAALPCALIGHFHFNCPSEMSVSLEIVM